MFRNMTAYLMLVSCRPISGNPESSVLRLSATLGESSTIMVVPIACILIVVLYTIECCYSTST
jgi:uncharacterized protein HemY